MQSAASPAAKPAQIRLSPYSQLPQLHLYSATSPTGKCGPFPVIATRSKAKTEPSQHHPVLRERVKTEANSTDKEQESPSFRLISRFIYKHLQKKISFQTQFYKNYQDASLSCDLDATPNPNPNPSRRHQEPIFNTKHNKYQSCVYAYEKSQPGRETNHTQTLKFKNKYNIKTKAALRNLPKDDLSSSKRNRSKNRYANIDSYFDLSCLETCTPKSRLG